MSSAPPSPASRRRAWLVAGLLGLAALAAYWNTFSAPFVFDDSGVITENPTIRSFATALTPPAGNSVTGRPVVNLSFALNYALSGERVWSYHAFNLLVHFLAACTLFGLVRRTLELPRLRPRFGDAALALAAAVAAIWLLHPLQTEAVTYVVQRTESLAGLLMLLTLYAFGRAVTAEKPLRWYVLTVAACLVTDGTKEIAATLPLLVFLFDGAFVCEGYRDAWRRHRGIHLALVATWVPLAMIVLGSGGDRSGSTGFEQGVPPWSYWLNQFEAIVTYLRLALWPHPLIFERGTFWRSLAEAVPYALVVVPLIAASLVAVIRRPALGFLGAWFFVILSPTSVMPGKVQMIAEHRMYLPLAAVVAGIVAGAYVAFGRRSLVAWPVVALVLGGVTFARNDTYRSALALWSDTVARAPHNALAHYSLGVAYTELGRYDDAVREGELALQYDQPLGYARRSLMIHNKLGFDLAKLGRLPEAVAHYEAALREKPDYAVAHLNLARALVQLDRQPEAIGHFQEAIRLGAGVDAHAELADALMHEGRFAEAVEHCQAVARLTPTSAPAFNNLGYALISVGHAEEAVAAYREAVRLDARYAAAWVGLGYALISAGHSPDAIDPCRRAVALQPNLADAHNTLGIALAQTGRLPEAIASFEQALRLSPNAADVHNNLGNALADAGRTAEAVAEYREAVRLRPDYADAHRNLGHELQRLGQTSEGAEHLATADRLEAETRNDRRPISR
ncbi:MAG TPA: tetratricopeptide repeat protein [Lacunisphaera sp.]|nr:tetratricopeptide repeat protein [Lacunisphaera sp.]